MRLTRRDRDGARAKLAKANMTARQLNALEDMIIKDAIQEAEWKACATGNKRTHRLTGVGSLLTFMGPSRRAKEAIRIAVYWYHERSGHRQEVPEEQQYEMQEQPSNWRPAK